MSLLLVPHEAGTDRLTLWIGAIDEPGLDPATILVALVQGQTGPVAVTGLPVGSWQVHFDAQDRHVLASRLEFDGLLPRTTYRFEARRNVTSESSAVATTLPLNLPRLDERPFTVMLGSCFNRGTDGAGEAGRTYANLPADARPDIKILCGDQVYLDQPVVDTNLGAFDRERMHRLFLDNYAATWAQVGGFRELLREGATFFTSDDHDFWNNAPNWTFNEPATFNPEIRADWFGAALALYRVFQRAAGTGNVSTFSVGNLSFCIPDTRIGRSEGDDRFMSSPDLVAVTDWVRNLAGPGCLVLGQVVFDKKRPWWKQLADYGLADFDQYPTLVRAFAGAQHTVVVLTGDVHYGRIAVTQLALDRAVVEVISSPLSLVGSPFPNTWEPAPPKFPSFAMPGVVSTDVRTESTYQLNANHFATIAFTQSGGFVRMQVRAWPTRTNGQQPAPAFDYSTWIS